MLKCYEYRGTDTNCDMKTFNPICSILICLYDPGGICMASHSPETKDRNFNDICHIT